MYKVKTFTWICIFISYMYSNKCKSLSSIWINFLHNNLDVCVCVCDKSQVMISRLKGIATDTKLENVHVIQNLIKCTQTLQMIHYIGESEYASNTIVPVYMLWKPTQLYLKITCTPIHKQETNNTLMFDEVTDSRGECKDGTESIRNIFECNVVKW